MTQTKRTALAGLGVMFGIALLTPARLEARRVPCADVIKEVDNVIGRRGSYRPDPLRIARRLGVDPEWVVRCTRVYGRRLSKEPARLIDVERDQQDEHWENDEAREVGRDEQDAGVVDEPSLSRREERRTGPRVEPTPISDNPDREFQEGFR